MKEGKNKVRFIPPGYYTVFKHSFHQTHYLKKHVINDSMQRLGGEYEVISIEESGAPIVDVTDKNMAGAFPEGNYVGAKDFKPCPYKIGDRVKFTPKCSESDIHMLLDSRQGKDLGLNIQGNIFVIQHILNDYYIFLDCEYDEKLGYITDGFPFHWIDFSKV